MLKALIFDFDGTIANTLPVCINAFKRTVEPVLGKEMSLQEVRSYFGPAEEGIFAKHFPDRQRKLTTKSTRKNKQRFPILFQASWTSFAR